MKQKDKYDIVLRFAVVILIYVATTFVIMKIFFAVLPFFTHNKPTYDRLDNGGYNDSKAT